MLLTDVVVARRWARTATEGCEPMRHWPRGVVGWWHNVSVSLTVIPSVLQQSERLKRYTLPGKTFGFNFREMAIEVCLHEHLTPEFEPRPIPVFCFISYKYLRLKGAPSPYVISGNCIRFKPCVRWKFQFFPSFFLIRQSQNPPLLRGWYKVMKHCLYCHDGDACV